MKQSDIKKLCGKEFFWRKAYTGDIWDKYKLKVCMEDDAYIFVVTNTPYRFTDLSQLAYIAWNFEGKVSSKDFIDLDSGETMYDILKKYDTEIEYQIKPINYNYINNVDLPKDIRCDCSTIVAMANGKEPKNDKIFLHSCHHLSSELKEVAVYMIKFMRLCKKCSQNTFYTVMKDKFPKLYYEERNTVAYRMLQDKVITAIEDMYATRHYVYTPEEVNK